MSRDFHDLVAAFNLEEFTEAEGDKHPVRRIESEILYAARRLVVVAWDEQGLSRFLDRAVHLAKVKGINDWSGEAFQKLLDKLVVDARKRQFPGRG